MATQAPVSLQVDVTFDSGSMSRHPTPRIGSDGILRDGEGREAYDASNHNIHPRNYLRMSSVSPSSDSPHRRPFHSAVMCMILFINYYYMQTMIWSLINVLHHLNTLSYRKLKKWSVYAYNFKASITSCQSF